MDSTRSPYRVPLHQIHNQEITSTNILTHVNAVQLGDSDVANLVQAITTPQVLLRVTLLCAHKVRKDISTMHYTLLLSSFFSSLFFQLFCHKEVKLPIHGHI